MKNPEYKEETLNENPEIQDRLRGGPFFRTGFTILSRKAFPGPHPPTLQSFRKAIHKPVHQEIQDRALLLGT